MTKPYYKPLIFLTILLSLFFLSSCRDTLTPVQSLFDREILISSGGAFALGFFTPMAANNNHRYVGIWYYNIPVHTVIWVANRRHPIIGSSGVLSITANGTLIISNGVNSSIIWSSALRTNVYNPTAQLLDTGNFVVANDNDPNNFAWQSFDYPTDTLIPGMKLGWNLTSGLNRNLTQWSSSTDPSPGNYTFAVDLSGDPQLRLWIGATRAMRSGPWTGDTFSDLLPFHNSYNTELKFVFVNNQDEVYYTCEVVSSSTITRLVVNETGNLQRFIWVGSGQWSLYWYNPRTQCDVALSVCGTYGVCKADGLPICSCLPGFLPKSQANWDLRVWSDGCIRKTALDCKSGTDGFLTVHRTFLPDTMSATVDRTLSLGECKSLCLKNCSCTAFASADTRGGGSGCIIWSTNLEDTQTFTEGGQDLYIRLAAADIDSLLSVPRQRRKSTLAIVLSTIFGTLLLAGVVCITWRRWKKIRGNITTSTVETVAESTREREIELPLFDLGTIVAATDNFSNENKLGEGGFGPVYRGKIPQGQEIAVKRLSKTSIQGLEELKTEVMLVAKLQHRNLVRVLGYCIQDDERMLIYEYMPNKSLDAFLFGEQNEAILDWQTRYQIIHGIARGLLYLHQDSRFRIIHRDLKASNILLDKDMNPKISDFGLARIFGGDEAKTMTRRVVGTYGYMSPEYALNGIFSIKSDVFSFGVLVLEIISGKRNKGVYLSDSEEYLLGNAWTLLKEGKGLQLVDASLGGSFDACEVLRCIKVGLQCIQENPRDRPTMSSVVLMLGSDHALLHEPKEPGFVTRKSCWSETSSSKENLLISVNDVTITMFGPR